jgi:uncharacterized protein
MNAFELVNSLLQPIVTAERDAVDNFRYKSMSHLMVRIAFATDIHGRRDIMDWLRERMKDCDLALIGGDIDDYGLTLDILAFTENTNTVVVLGNHDYPIAQASDKKYKGLHGDTIKINGIKIGGLSGSLPVGGWPFEVSESEYKLLLKKIGKVDILLTHNPPYDTRCDITYRQEHVGSKEIRDYIKKKTPKLVFCGHIHESQGIDNISITEIINPGAYANGNYVIVEYIEKKDHLKRELTRNITIDLLKYPTTVA